RIERVAARTQVHLDVLERGDLDRARHAQAADGAAVQRAGVPIGIAGVIDHDRVRAIPAVDVQRADDVFGQTDRGGVQAGCCGGDEEGVVAAVALDVYVSGVRAVDAEGVVAAGEDDIDVLDGADDGLSRIGPRAL